MIDNILITENDGFITGLTFERNTIKEYTPLLNEAYEQIQAYLKGDLKVFNLPIRIDGGTEFQRKVWSEIVKIPYGETVTYKELAFNCNSKAYRAVGSACGKNPIAIIIPCHRVFSSGGIGGFSSPMWIKKHLLRIEHIL